MSDRIQTTMAGGMHPLIAASGLARKPRRLVAALAACVLGLCFWASPARAEITFLNAWGSQGSGDEQFDLPFGVAVSPAGDVYVVDTLNHRIQKFDSSGGFLTKWGSYGTGDGQVDWPLDVAVSAAGDVFVADTNNHRMQRFDGSGTFLTKWGSNGTGDGQFDMPWGVAASPAGDVYVADAWNNRIQRFDSSGGFLTKWGSYGTGDGQFSKPYSVGVSPTGEVYVADRWNNRIQEFYASGAFRTKWGSAGTGDGQFDWPCGLAVGSTGDVYVADTDNHRIQKFDSSGGFLTKWGSEGSGDGQFNDPQGMAVSATGQVHVADTYNHRIQRFFDSDAWVSGTNYFDNAAVGAGELLGASLVLDAPKTLIVSDTTTIQSDGTLILDGGELSAVNLTGSGRFRFTSGTLRLQGGQISLAGPLDIHGDGTLRGQGLVSGPVVGSAMATIVAEGGFAMGDAYEFNGFNHAGTLSVGSHTVTLNSSGFAGLGVLTTLGGGTLEAPNGVALGVGDNLSGSGTVNAKVAAALGSTIMASGWDLTLGDAASPAGFASDGELRVSFQTVTIHDADQAVLGTLTTMGVVAVLPPYYHPGTLTVPNGALLEFGKSLDGFGTVNGEFVNHGDVYGGTGGQTLEFMDPVTGVGDFHNSVTFSGGYSPGLSPIEVDLDDVTFSATNTLSIELGGLSPGSDFDKLNISGAAALGGTLAISLINNFTPQVGDELEIMTYASAAGQFAETTGWLFDGNKALVKVHGANALTLTATYHGDATLDFCVDGLDYVAWSNNYKQHNKQWQEGDYTGEGYVDGLDYIVWSNNYQTGCPGMPGAVPEPSSALVLILGICALLRRRSAQVMRRRHGA